MNKKDIERQLTEKEINPCNVIRRNTYTRASRRRGYNAIQCTKTFYFWWDGHRLTKTDCRVDELTGKHCEYREWLIPIPSQFHGCGLKSTGIGQEMIEIDSSVYCHFQGTPISAKVLSPDAVPYDWRDHRVSAVGDYYISWTLFWDLEWRSQFWESFTSVYVDDGVFSVVECTPQTKQDRIILLSPQKQLSLFGVG